MSGSGPASLQHRGLIAPLHPFGQCLELGVERILGGDLRTSDRQPPGVEPAQRGVALPPRGPAPDPGLWPGYARSRFPRRRSTALPCRRVKRGSEGKKERDCSTWASAPARSPRGLQFPDLRDRLVHKLFAAAIFQSKCACFSRRFGRAPVRAPDRLVRRRPANRSPTTARARSISLAVSAERMAGLR